MQSSQDLAASAMHCMAATWSIAGKVVATTERRDEMRWGGIGEGRNGSIMTVFPSKRVDSTGIQCQQLIASVSTTRLSGSHYDPIFADILIMILFYSSLFRWVINTKYYTAPVLLAASRIPSPLLVSYPNAPPAPSSAAAAAAASPQMLPPPPLSGCDAVVLLFDLSQARGHRFGVARGHGCLT